MEIKAAVVYEQSGKFSIEQLQLSEPNDDEVLVRIVGAGICHTDLAARDQHLPIPLPSRSSPGPPACPPGTTPSPIGSWMYDSRKSGPRSG